MEERLTLMCEESQLVQTLLRNTVRGPRRLLWGASFCDKPGNMHRPGRPEGKGNELDAKGDCCLRCYVKGGRDVPNAHVRFSP